MGACFHVEGVMCPNCRDLRLFGDTSAVRYTDDTRLEALESRVAQLEAVARLSVHDEPHWTCAKCNYMSGANWGLCSKCGQLRPVPIEASARPGTRPGTEKSMDEPVGQPVSDRPDNPAALVTKCMCGAELSRVNVPLRCMACYARSAG